MSLICWWPLNGDTKNYGTLGGEIEVAASSPVYTDGKIGKALYTGALSLTAEQWKKIIGNTTSIAMWIYTRDDGSYSAGTPFFGNAGMTKPNNRKFAMFHYPNKTALHCSWQHDDLDSTDKPNTYVSVSYNDFFEIGKWIHLCVVQDAATETVTIYKNGTQYSKINVSGLATMNFKSAAAAPIRNGINYQHTNDIRIYDHALSAAEVKELSKALVCHYKLDACNNTNLLLNSGNPSFNGYITKSSGSIVYDNILKTNVFECSNTATSEKFVFYSNRFPIIGGETYTFSCDVYCNEYLKNLDIYLLSSSTLEVSSMATTFDNPNGIKYFNRSQTSTPDKLIPGQWVHISGALTPNSNQTTAYIRIDNNGTSSSGTAAVLRVANCKFERGSKPAPFGVHLSESLYETLEPDCSGLGNDAIKYGTLAYHSDSAVNGSCTVFPGTAGNYINCGKGGKVKDAITVNWWGYMDSWSSYGRAISCTDGGGWNFEPSSGKMNFACGTGTSTNAYKSVASNTNLDSLSQGWHMFTGTYDGKATKIYIDGICENTNNAYTTKTPLYYVNNSIFIGAEAQSGENNPTSPYFSGRMADVRIYGTALSDEDIQELYRTRAYVTNAGDFMCGNFVESITDIMVTEKSTTEALEFIEDSMVNGEYEKIEYLEFSEKEYIDTGLAFPDENIPIIIETEIIKTVLSSNDCLAGCGDGAWTGPIMLNCHNGTCEFGVNGYATASDGSGSFAAGERLIIRAEIGTKSTEHNWYKNGVKINLGSSAYRDRTGSSSTLYIGAFHIGTGASVVSDSCWIGRLYFFKVWYGGYSRILVPARRKSDGVLGLYDAAGSGFYPNINGNGQLKAGQDVDKTEAAFYKNGKILSREIIEI